MDRTTHRFSQSAADALVHGRVGDGSRILSGVESGDEVIMPSYTFVSTANAFVLRGAIPVFVDIRSDTLNLDESRIEAAITPRTRAIAPVHYAGVGCEMEAIMDIATRHNLVVVEDAAQGIDARYREHALGSIGHLGCLSFHETKNVVSGEGGALLINDEQFIERAEVIREKGTNRSQFFRGEVDKYTWVDIGSSYLPSELVAAFLLLSARAIKRDQSGTHCDLEYVSQRICGARKNGASAPADNPREREPQCAHVLRAFAGSGYSHRCHCGT